MPRKEEIKDIPESDIIRKVPDYIRVAATEIKITKQTNGKWTIEAVLPN